MSLDLPFLLIPVGSLFQTEIRGEANLTFQDARLKLLAYVRNEVRNGELTERGFARLIGISQPHAHNVLKGVELSHPSLRSGIKIPSLSLLDLASMEELEAQLQRRRSRQSSIRSCFPRSAHRSRPILARRSELAQQLPAAVSFRYCSR